MLFFLCFCFSSHFFLKQKYFRYTKEVMRDSRVKDASSHHSEFRTDDRDDRRRDPICNGKNRVNNSQTGKAIAGKWRIIFFYAFDYRLLKM